MLNRTHWGIAVLALALTLAGGSRAQAQDQSGDHMAMRSSSAPLVLPMPGHINWSDRYQFTPLEQKRLEAMGLSKEEAWAVAKGARESGREVDDVAQMVLRGRSYFQIAEELGVPYNSLLRWPARWQTPQWEELVRNGSPVWVPGPGAETQENEGQMGGRRGRSGSMRGMMPGGERVSAATCPVCHMQLTTTASAAAPRAVTVEGKTYYCCAGCDMSKLSQ